MKILHQNANSTARLKIPQPVENRGPYLCVMQNFSCYYVHLKQFCTICFIHSTNCVHVSCITA